MQNGNGRKLHVFACSKHAAASGEVVVRSRKSTRKMKHAMQHTIICSRLKQAYF